MQSNLHFFHSTPLSFSLQYTYTRGEIHYTWHPCIRATLPTRSVELILNILLFRKNTSNIVHLAVQATAAHLAKRGRAPLRVAPPPFG